MFNLVTITGCARRLNLVPMTLHRYIKATPSIQVYKLNATTFLVSFAEVKQELIKAGKLPQSDAA
jgi:hypothetical protein